LAPGSNNGHVAAARVTVDLDLRHGKPASLGKLFFKRQKFLPLGEPLV